MKNIQSISIVKLFLLLLLTISLQSLYSQGINSQTYNQFLHEFNAESAKSNYKTYDKNEVSGSPYFNDEFILGNIITNENLKYTNVPLRYNIFNDNIEFKSINQQILALSNPKLFKEIQIGDVVFIYCESDSDIEGYYGLKQNGETKLLIKYGVVFNKATPAGAYKEASPDRFHRRSNKLFIKTKNNYPFQISNKKDLEIYFGEKSKKMLAFIKKEKINIKKEEGLQKLVVFINQME